MKTRFGPIDPLRVFALALLILPVAAVFGFGLLWLWQRPDRLFWLLAMAGCVATGFVLERWLVHRDRKLLGEAATEPNPDWPPAAESVWMQVEALAETCEPQDWPLEDGARMLVLGRRTLETVAHAYHPDVERPVLELTVPHALLIIERASRDLRHDIAGNVPFSHRLTIGDLLRVGRWKSTAERAFDLYRAGRLVVNPLDALIGEAWRHLRSRSFGLARTELHRWFLHAYVRKVGYYAIDLYSGRLPLDDEKPAISPTPSSSADLDAADRAEGETEEPLRILILGRINAGKSSLVNALFGRLAAPTDALPGTTQVLAPFILEREGLARALVFDSPGCDSVRFDRKRMHEAALSADLILWVSNAMRADRGSERECLDVLRAFLAAHPERRPPPLLVVVSHIDRLRPAAEWQPPYDLERPDSAKATQIRAAVEAVAADLGVPIEEAIPVCLLEGRTYNVEDVLWAAMLDRQDDALKTRLLRCLDVRRRAADWHLLREQFASAGRLLRDLPERIGRFTSR